LRNPAVVGVFSGGFLHSSNGVLWGVRGRTRKWIFSYVGRVHPFVPSLFLTQVGPLFSEEEGEKQEM